MALRTTGVCWLTLMMRAERAHRRREDPIDSEWLLYGPTDPDPDAVEDEDEPPQLLAAE